MVEELKIDKEAPQNGVLFFYISTILSYLAGMMYSYANVIYVSWLTGSQAYTGLIYFISFFPFLFLNLYGGVLADRYSRKKILLVAQSVYAISAAVFSVMVYLSGNESVSFVFVLMMCLVNAVAFSFLPSARLSMVADLVPSGKIKNATIIVNLTFILSVGIGPLLIGLLKENYSWMMVYAAPFVCYLLSNLMLLCVKSNETTSKTEGVDFKYFMEGVKYIKSSHLIWQFLMLTCVATIILGPLEVLVPLYLNDVLGLSEADRGIFMGLLGLGLLLGGILSMLAGKFLNKALLVIIGIVISSIFLMFLSFVDSVTWAVICVVLSSMFGSFSVNLITVILQSEVVDEMRGRVMSFFSLFYIVSPAVSALFLSIISERVGFDITFQLSAIFIILASIMLFLLFPSIRKFSDNTVC